MAATNVIKWREKSKKVPPMGGGGGNAVVDMR